MGILKSSRQMCLSAWGILLNILTKLMKMISACDIIGISVSGCWNSQRSRETVWEKPGVRFLQNE